MAARLSRIIPVSLTLLAAMALSACTSQQAPALKEGEKPVDVASVVRQKMPASVKDREAWAQAIATAFDSQKAGADGRKRLLGAGGRAARV